MTWLVSRDQLALGRSGNLKSSTVASTVGHPFDLGNARTLALRYDNLRIYSSHSASVEKFPPSTYCQAD